MLYAPRMIDSHAHLAWPEAFEVDREEVIGRMKLAGVTGWLEVGTDLAQSRRALALAEKYDNCYATVGVHPTDVGNLREEEWPEVVALAAQEKVKAIGEVGFDFYRTSLKLRPASRTEQAAALERFVDLAQQVNKPVVFHVRDSQGVYDAQAALLEFLQTRRVPGVIHTFSGTVRHAQEYVKLGLYLSFSGVVTFKKVSEEVRAAAKWCPPERLVIETDSPWLTPSPYRGQRNEPAHVRRVAEEISKLRGVSVEEIDILTAANSRRLFGWKD
jgi:TatD DNase family protein